MSIKTGDVIKLATKIHKVKSTDVIFGRNNGGGRVFDGSGGKFKLGNMTRALVEIWFLEKDTPYFIFTGKRR